jgi:hypothetical protein
MASIVVTGILGALMFALTPGVFISIPPGPNRLWLFGGQVTTFNAMVHAVVFSLIVLYFV